MPLSTAVPKLPSTRHQTRNVTNAPRRITGTKTEAHPVGQSLERGLVTLCLVDEALEPCKYRFGGDGGHLDYEGTRSAPRAARHRRARAAVDRQRLAGEH